MIEAPWTLQVPYFPRQKLRTGADRKRTKTSNELAMEMEVAVRLWKAEIELWKGNQILWRFGGDSGVKGGGR